jgi:serine/threonine-protein kinase
VAPGTTVTITVSKGEEQVTIPSVGVGMSFETAEENLRSAGFKGEVQEAFENSNSVGKDYVTRYSPSSTVSPNGTVTIYVSLGAAE